MSGARAVFLDRDGVLIEERAYLRDPGDVVLTPGAGAALRRLREAGWLVILVTNQSGVARGYFTEADVERVHAALRAQLTTHGAILDAICVCPHHPAGVVEGYARICTCRKPAPGMLLEAIREFRVDPARSVMIGDKHSDLEAAQAAGAEPILVETGYGAETRATVPDSIRVFPTLADAVDALLAAC